MSVQEQLQVSRDCTRSCCRSKKLQRGDLEEAKLLELRTRFACLASAIHLVFALALDSTRLEWKRKLLQ